MKRVDNIYHHCSFTQTLKITLVVLYIKIYNINHTCSFTQILKITLVVIYIKIYNIYIKIMQHLYIFKAFQVSHGS